MEILGPNRFVVVGKLVSQVGRGPSTQGGRDVTSASGPGGGQGVQFHQPPAPLLPLIAHGFPSQYLLHELSRQLPDWERRAEDSGSQTFRNPRGGRGMSRTH